MKTFKSLMLLTTALLAYSFTATAQSYEQERVFGNRNIIKVKPLTFEFGYERVLNDFLSVQATGRFLPIGIRGENGNGDAGLSLNNYRIMPEVRFYVAGRKGAPQGFFLAPYLKAGLTTIKAETTSATDQTANVKFRGSSLGAGFTLGWQWVAQSGFSLDTQFGWGYNRNHFNDVTVTYSDGTREVEQAPIDNLTTMLPRFSFSIGYAF
ncbi:MAG: DUF3575 domain-containing protein [Phaeodactylibacter sp.]|nr:DUF3575 domain-containing protein [Phaeodactylibacter sp.]